MYAAWYATGRVLWQDVVCGARWLPGVYGPVAAAVEAPAKALQAHVALRLTVRTALSVIGDGIEQGYCSSAGSVHGCYAQS